MRLVARPSDARLSNISANIVARGYPRSVGAGPPRSTGKVTNSAGGVTTSPTDVDLDCHARAVQGREKPDPHTAVASALSGWLGGDARSVEREAVVGNARVAHVAEHRREVVDVLAAESEQVEVLRGTVWCALVNEQQLRTLEHESVGVA